MQEQCSKCKGKGYIWKSDGITAISCDNCDGSGWFIGVSGEQFGKNFTNLKKVNQKMKTLKKVNQKMKTLKKVNQEMENLITQNYSTSNRLKLFKTEKDQVVIRQDLIISAQHDATNPPQIRFRLQDGNQITLKGTKSEFEEICEELAND